MGSNLHKTPPANAKEVHQTVVMVTHDQMAASHADTVLFLADG